MVILKTQLQNKNHIKTEKQANKNNVAQLVTYKEKENDDNLRHKKIFLAYVIKAINSARSIEEANKIFKNILTSKNFFQFKAHNFNNNMQKMVAELNDIKYNLSIVQSKNMLTRLTKVFINKNMALLRLTGNSLYHIDYMKSKVLNSFYQNNNPQFISADVIRASIINKDFSFDNYRLLENKLTNWLIDNIYKESNRQYIEDNENLKNRNNLLWSIRSENNIPYLGQDDSFYTQINILHDRKTVLQRQKRNEFIILNRKYPSAKKGLFGFDMCSRNLNNMFKLSKRLLFSKRDMILPYGNNVTYEDKVYGMFNVFYNKKYIKIDNEEKELIRKYKLKLKNESTKKNKQQIKYYINKNLNISLNTIKFWNSRNQNEVKQSVQNNCFSNGFEKSSIEYILNVTANRVTNLLDFSYEAKKNNENINEDLTDFNLFKRAKSEDQFNSKLSRFSGLVKNVKEVIANASSDDSEVNKNYEQKSN